MVTNRKTLCFTGHRPNKLADYSGPKVDALHSAIKNKLIDVVIRASNAGFNTFISGGALGVDQIAARAVIHVRDVLNRNVELEMAIPFPAQPNGWPENARQTYFTLLNASNSVVYCSQDPFSSAKMRKRNMWMVDHSEVVVAIYNNTGGGTKNCIDYARNMKRPVLIINPFTLEERWEH